MASDTEGLEVKATATAEALVLLQQDRAKIDVRLATLSESMTVCTAVLDDLKALNKVLERKSLQNLNLKPQKETEDTLPKKL